MINRRMKNVDVYILEKQESVFGKETIPRKLKSVQMAISTNTGQSAQYNAVNAKDSTHIGLTRDKSLQKAQEVHSDNDVYAVEYVNNDGKFAQVFLNKVVPDDGE